MIMNTVSRLIDVGKDDVESMKYLESTLIYLHNTFSSKCFMKVFSVQEKICVLNSKCLLTLFKYF